MLIFPVDREDRPRAPLTPDHPLREERAEGGEVPRREERPVSAGREDRPYGPLTGDGLGSRPPSQVGDGSGPWTSWPSSRLDFVSFVSFFSHSTSLRLINTPLHL